MNKSFYLSLAKTNIKRNRNAFFPFALSSATMIALFYMIDAIYGQVKNNDANFYGQGSMEQILSFGVIICGIFAAGVIFYTNRFLIKQRSKELGLYSILGMEKRHISKVLFFETAVVGAICISAGLFFGILFSKLMFLVLLKMMKLNASIPFGISASVILRSILIFTAVFGINILQNILRLSRMKTIDLLHDESMGEQEPKANWIFAALGVICLFIGYYIAVTTKNPIKALNLFFIAVLFVMAGTHFLFLSGSIVLLKLLRKNKAFYYHKTHMITVSGMMHRMKRNAAGLANICILSASVLVVISSTISLYVGIYDLLHNTYPRDVIVSFYSPTEAARAATLKQTGEEAPPTVDPEKIQDAVLEHANQHNLTLSHFHQNFNLFTVVWEKEDHVYQEERQGLTEDDSVMINFCSLKEYNQSVDKRNQLEETDGQTVWVLDNRGEISNGDAFSICGMKFFAKTLEKDQKDEDIQLLFTQDYTAIEMEYHSIQILVPDKEALDHIADKIYKDRNEETLAQIQYTFLFDVDGNTDDIDDFCGALWESFYHKGITNTGSTRNIFDEKSFIEGLYTSLFFIGIFIAVMFLLTTVLIIYYKQISEGYEDRARFEILQKVGMGQKEVKRVIKSQIVQVFFLPLILAASHIAFSFPMIRRILAIMGLINVNLYAVCTSLSILVFAIVYGIVYYLTARSYYRIVYGKH